VLKCTGAVNKRPLNIRMDKITKRKTYQFVLLTSYSQGIKKAGWGGCKEMENETSLYSTISGTTVDMYRQTED
jgi:hypothetical protein